MGAVGTEFEGARRPGSWVSEQITISKNIFIVSLTAPDEAVITRPSGDERILVMQFETGTWRVRPGDYLERTFADGDVDLSDDVAVVTSHGYTTGDGPYKLSNSGGALPGGLGTADALFYVGVDPDLADPDEIAFYSTHADALADTNRVNITTAAGGGTHSIGGMLNNGLGTAPTASITDGYASVRYVAATTNTQFAVKFAAPRKMSLSCNVTGIVSYWWL